MYMIGVFCLVATAIALPVLPDPPSLPESSVTVQEQRLHTNVPEVVEVVEVEREEKKDDIKDEKEDKAIPLLVLPNPPELPPLEESIYKNFKISDEELPIKLNIIEDEKDKKEKPEAEDEKPVAEAEKSEEPKEEPKAEEPKKEDVEVKIEEVKEKPLADPESPIVVKWKLPRPTFLNNIISSLPSLPFWPFNRPSLFGSNPRTNYPGYVLVEE